MPLTEISPNTFTSTTTGRKRQNFATAAHASPTIIFLIPGNPGLISYYHTFLSLLAENLSSRNRNPNTTAASNCADGQHDQQNKDQDPNSEYYLIHGRSLGGFELKEEPSSSLASSNHGPTARYRQDKFISPSTATNHGVNGGKPHLYNLNEQIRFTEEKLSSCIRKWKETYHCQSVLPVDKAERIRNGEPSAPSPKVVLIGHSVGAYIAMEIIRRQREGLKSKSSSSRSQTGGGGGEDALEEMDIISGVLLFPTVVDIAKSRSGRVLTALLYIPYLALLASLLTKLLAFLLPKAVLRFIVRVVMRFPPEEAANTTLGLVTSKSGIHQALHMAADEMQQITSDKWSDEIWGISSSLVSNPLPPLQRSNKLTKLFLYFGRDDHWVADQTRDEIIHARGGNSNNSNAGPSIVVCEDAVPHGFCIRHNDIMARKVGDFIKELAMDQN